MPDQTLRLKLEGFEDLNKTVKLIIGELGGKLRQFQSIGFKGRNLPSHVSPYGGVKLSSFTGYTPSVVQSQQRRLAAQGRLAQTTSQGAAAAQGPGLANIAGQYLRGGYVASSAMKGNPYWISQLPHAMSSLGKMGPYVAGAVAALGTFAAVIKAVTSVLGEWRDVFWKSGANRRGASGVAGVAAALGMDPSSVAGKAGSFPGGSRQFLALLKSLSAIKSDEGAFYAARALGLEDYLGIRDLDKQDQDRVLSGKGFEMSSADRKTQARFQMAWGEFLFELKKLLAEAAPLIELITDWFKNLTKTIRGLKKLFGGGETDPNKSMLTPPGGFKPKKAAEQMDRAADKFSDAVKTFSNAIGVFGGIANNRARGAFPQAWAWYGNQQAMNNDALRMGAFTV